MTRVFLLSFAVAQLLSVSTAADFERSVLFRSGRDGYHTYRIPSLLATPRGTLLAFCEGRKTGRGDSGDLDILVKRSDDGGASWSGQEIVWDDEQNTCGNPCPVIDGRTGRIWLLLTWNLGSDHGGDLHAGTAKDTRRVFKCCSDDDGRTWSKPVEITAETKDPSWWWYATGPGVGIQLKHGPHKGRLVVPCDHTAADYFFGSHAIYSDDGGGTWRRSQAAQPTCNESQVVELADGTLMLNMRSQDAHGSVTLKTRPRNGYRSIALSRDGGQTWTAPEFDKQLGDPVCQASFLRYSLAAEEDCDRLLFSNPNPPISPKRGTRIRMTVRASYDEGKTWPVAKLVHAGPSAYSCLARLPDGRIGLLFEAGDQGASETITFARFTLGWLTDGPDRRE